MIKCFDRRVLSKEEFIFVYRFREIVSLLWKERYGGRSRKLDFLYCICRWEVEEERIGVGIKL